MTEQDPVIGFSRELTADRLAYRVVGAQTEQQAHIRFTGEFDGATVIWDATVIAQGSDSRSPQQIDVAATGYPLRPVTIALNIPAIDHRVLLRTIIMIRKYRLLHAGRHEFGHPRT